MPSITYNIELVSSPDRIDPWAVMVRLHLKDQKPGRILMSVKIVNAPKRWQAKKWRKWRKVYPDGDAINQNIEFIATY